LKVNISYTVDLDKVPSEVEKLLKDCSALTKEVLSDLSDVKIENVLATVELLRETRGKVSSLEIGLDDCLNILTGYLNVQASLEHQGNNALEDNNAE